MYYSLLKLKTVITYLGHSQLWDNSLNISFLFCTINIIFVTLFFARGPADVTLVRKQARHNLWLLGLL